MSSMVRAPLIAALLVSAAALPVPALAQGDQGRDNLVAQQSSGQAAYAVSRWEQLSASPNFTFEDYAGFLLSYPGFPDRDVLRGYAEGSLANQYVAADRLVAYFDRFPPLTNPGRAQYALALMAMSPDAALETARAAWRGGQMSQTAAATLLSTYGASFTPADHDARMDALLWQRDPEAAGAQMAYVSQTRAPVFAARLAILQGGDGATYDGSAASDPGYLWNRSRELRTEGRVQEAASLLASHPPLAAAPFNPTAWIEEHLAVARQASSQGAQQIAARAS
jgi:soluble lytic murein transglycosylase